MNITIGRYPCPTDEPAATVSDRWESWIEPDDKSWIVFIATDGTPTMWLHRDENGGVIGEPVTR